MLGFWGSLKSLGRSLASIVFLIVTVSTLQSCGGATGTVTGGGGFAAPPISIPTPGVANIAVTSPDESGIASIIGEAGAVEASAAVRIYTVSESSASIYKYFSINNAEASNTLVCSTTADITGAFSCDATLSVGTDLCITQVGSDSSDSDCASADVPADQPPLRLSNVVDTSIDVVTGNTFMLGLDSDGNYKLKVFSNSTKRLLNSYSVSAINAGMATDTLTSVAAYNGSVLITGYAQAKLYKFAYEAGHTGTDGISGFSANDTTNYVVANTCPSPTMVRFDPFPENGHNIFLFCQKENGATDFRTFIELDGSLNVTRTATASADNFDFNYNKTSLSYYGEHQWLVAASLSNSTTQLYSIYNTDNNALTYSMDTTVNINGIYRVYSGGILPGGAQGTYGNIAMGTQQSMNTASVTGLKTTHETDNHDIILPNSAAASDAICRSTTDCSTAYVLSASTNTLYTYNLSTGTAVFSSSTSVGGLNPNRVLIDQVNSRLVIVDSASLALYWVSVP